MEPMYLIYRTGFAPTNGTSVYLSRLLSGLEDQLVHLMWDISEAGRESVKQLVVADDATAWQWPFPRGRRLFARVRKQFNLHWWHWDRLNEAKLIRELQTLHSRPKRAWVICMHEQDARRACALWEAVGRPPFVLHVMDIFHDRLSDDDTPNFRRLVREASHVLCISENIATEMMYNGAKSVSILPCCSDFSAIDRTRLEAPLRMVITGKIWLGVYSNNPAIQLLVATWPEIQRQFPGVELHYSGASGKKLPEDLRRVVHDHGLLDHAKYEALLRSCHLAYLPVSHPSSSVGRFSLPSRLADYLACGLPTIACTDEGTAIASFLNSLPNGCALNISNSQSLLEAIATFAGDPKHWREASIKAAAFAREQLTVENVRAELLRQLER